MILPRIASFSLLTSLMMAFAVATSSAHEQTAPPDRQIEQQVRDKLSDEEDLSDVTVTARGHEVTLSGTVPSVWAKEEAIKQALEVERVQSVVNDLTIETAESDAIVGEQVVEQILRYRLYTLYDHVDFGIDNGVVTLVGKVTQAIKATEIARRASRVRGVKELSNQIDVLPASAGDDNLRTVIARRIYRHPFLSQYANLLHPPIHIIVEHGRVTLTGAVSSQSDKQIAGRTASEIFGVLSVENNLRVSGR